MYKDCECSNKIVNGYGNCQRRSRRLGGRMFCIVDKDSNCNDKKESPYGGNYVSVEGCEYIDKGEDILFVLLKKQSNFSSFPNYLKKVSMEKYSLSFQNYSYLVI